MTLISITLKQTSLKISLAQEIYANNKCTADYIHIKHVYNQDMIIIGLITLLNVL